MSAAACCLRVAIPPVQSLSLDFLNLLPHYVYALARSDFFDLIDFVDGNPLLFSCFATLTLFIPC